MTTVRVHWRQEAVVRAVSNHLARGAVAAERLIQDEWRKRTGRPYPPASRPGEYPRRRSGRLMRGLQANINRTRWTVQLAVSNRARAKNGFDYPTHLERKLGRLGLRHLVRSLRAKIQRVLLRGVR